MAEEEEGFSGGEEDEEDSGEWTEESEEEEQADHRVMLKPVFVPKNKRATIVQREELEEEEERVAEQEAQRLLQRKEESKVLLVARCMHRFPTICFRCPCLCPLLFSTHRRCSCYSQKNLPPDQRQRRALLPTLTQQRWQSSHACVRYNGAFAGAIITDDEVRRNKPSFSKQKEIIQFILPSGGCGWGV